MEKTRKAIRKTQNTSGKVSGSRAGRNTAKVVKNAHITVKEASDFANSFIENFRRELGKSPRSTKQRKAR